MTTPLNRNNDVLVYLVNMDDCGTGFGGFKPGNTCAQKLTKDLAVEELQLSKYKSLGDIRGVTTSMQTMARKQTVVNKYVQGRSEQLKHIVAHVLNGVTEENVHIPGAQSDKKPADVWVKAPRRVAVEVKGMIIGNKPNISVHDDALLRKVEHVKKTSDHFVTVVIDDREGSRYSGHDVYFKAGSGAYKLSEMHKVKDVAELRRLVVSPPDKLPPAARGKLPPPPPLSELKQKAKLAKTSRNNKDRALKARKKLLKGGA